MQGYATATKEQDKTYIHIPRNVKMPKFGIKQAELNPFFSPHFIRQPYRNVYLTI